MRKDLSLTKSILFNVSLMLIRRSAGPDHLMEMVSNNRAVQSVTPLNKVTRYCQALQCREGTVLPRI